MTSEPQVPNPFHAALSALYASIQRDQAMGNALKSTCQQMGGSQAWFGSAADAWSAQLNGYSGDLASGVQAAVDAVGKMLAQTPATCTAGQAKAWSMFQRMGY